jgi:hypothetical protein
MKKIPLHDYTWSHHLKSHCTRAVHRELFGWTKIEVSVESDDDFLNASQSLKDEKKNFLKIFYSLLAILKLFQSNWVDYADNHLKKKKIFAVFIKHYHDDDFWHST